ncbi:MAG TPA: DUF5103 domain-containing protein, partial [Bacteroidia bacterium]|nr:DUF5103 domain-containing protein [Bacteroidia bacterium]
MKKIFFYFFFLTLFCFQSKAAEKNSFRKSFIFITQSDSGNEYYNPDYMRYSDHIYKSNIHTVQLHEKSWNLSPPLMLINSEQQLDLSFDDLDGDNKSYSYTLIHCDANWQPSNLHPMDYLGSFTQDQITDYSYSYNTIQRYTHYNLIFPNDNMQLTKTGNYIIEVYTDNDPDSLVLTKRFMVYDQKVKINAKVDRPIDANEAYFKQAIKFSIDYSGYNIADPYGSLTVVITQNGRWDNEINNLKPLYLKQNFLDYNYDQDNQFNGDNEFRHFDLQSLHYKTDRIAQLGTDSSKHDDVFLTYDEPRNFKRYFVESDINGNYLIKTHDGTNSDVESEYVNVHFFLPYEAPLTDGNLYVFGALSEWQCPNYCKMIYDYRAHGYKLTMYLKQGYYNYEYVYLKDGTNIADASFIEGTHFDTENDYTIYVYNR